MDASKLMISKDSDISAIDFLEGASILIDKPIEWTSFDVVNKVRFKLKYFLGVKKVKVGHAGTLDPLATGLLILCTGKFTKKLSDFQGMDKRYSGTMILGETTPSFDSESEPDKKYPIDHIDENLIEKTRKKFLGEIDQVPPIYSAVKIKGQKAYQLARRGKGVELDPRRICVKEFQIKRISENQLKFDVECSKGTYIRSLVHDFGQALNSGAYMSSLTRTAIGKYSLVDALALDDFINKIDALESNT